LLSKQRKRLGLVKTYIVIIICLLLLFAHGTGVVLSDDAGWKPVLDQGGLKVYNRSIKGQARELKALFKINARSWRVAEVVCDLDDYKDFMPFTVISKVISREKIDSNITKFVFFTAIHPPLVNMRYFTLDLYRENVFEGKKGWYSIKWALSESVKIDWKDPEVKNLFPKEAAKPVKVLFNKGHWVLEPVENNRKTLVHYYVQANPAGNLPSFLTEKANFVLLPKLKKAVSKRVKESKYDSMAPVAGKP